MTKKRKIYNPITGKYYEVKKSTGRKPKNVVGLWSEKKKKKINTRNKGNRIEREFMQVLKNSGKFVEIWKPCHCRANSDIFGLFDIIAINVFDDVCFFQVKGNRNHYYIAKGEIEPFAKKYYLWAWVVLKVKKNLWRVYDCSLDREYYVNDKFEEVEGK